MKCSSRSLVCRWILPLLLFGHLLLSVFYNTAITLHSQAELAGTVDESRYRAMLAIMEWRPLDWHAQYSGIACGYGFFSPQVASQYRWHYQTDAGVEQPAILRTHEGRVRFSAYMDMFSTLVFIGRWVGPSDSVSIRMAKAVARQLCVRTHQATDGATTGCQVILRHPAPLRESQEPHVHYVPLYQISLP